MAPERPKTLTVLDYTRIDGGFRVHVDRWDPQQAFTALVVTWASDSSSFAVFSWWADRVIAVMPRWPGVPSSGVRQGCADPGSGGTGTHSSISSWRR